MHDMLDACGSLGLVLYCDGVDMLIPTALQHTARGSAVTGGDFVSVRECVCLKF